MFGSRRSILRARRRDLLLDRFGVPVAAGALNNTYSSPGPGGLRTATDTESKGSIVNGQLVCSGPKTVAAWGDFGIWLPAITRQLGRTVVFGPLTLNAGDQCHIGFSAAKSSHMGNDVPYFYVFNSNLLRVRDGSINVNIGTWSIGTQYWFAIRERAAGAYYYVKSGDSNFKLVYVSNNGVSNGYPGISNYNAKFILDAIRIVAELWNPPVLCWDDHTGSDGAITTSKSTDADGLPAPVRTYTQVGTWAISSNTLVCSALDSGVAANLVDVGTPDTLTSVLLTRTAGTAGVYVRYVDADNNIRLIHDGTNVKLIKRVDGSEDTVVNVVSAYAAGAQIKVHCDGTKFLCYYNNALIGTEATISDGVLQSGTKVGEYTDDTGNSFDNFRCDARGNGHYDSLNKALR